MLSLALIYGYDHLTLNANAETTIQNCFGCVNNTSTQVLTIFNFQTNDNPFLAGNATFLITPNPYAHTTNATDYLDLTTWFNFVVSDGGEFDKDPTNGIIELIDVNNGTYSIMQIKGSSGFGLAYPEASDEILGTTGFAYVTQTFLNYTTTVVTTMEPPNISDTQFDKLTNIGGAKIGGKTMLNANDLPPAKIVTQSQKLVATPPDPIVFTMGFASNVTTTTLINTLGIPTYSPPADTSGNNAFMPPIFVTPFTNGSGKIMTTPVMDTVAAGSQIMIRGDNVNQGGTYSLFQAIELPLNTQGTNVAVSVRTETEIPTGKPILASGFVGLFLDVQSSGDINFTDSTVYDPNNKPTITFLLPKVGSACPTGVTLSLEHSGSWHTVKSNIISTSTGSNTCTYSVDVDHFSSYLVSTGNTEIGHNHNSGSSSHNHVSGDTVGHNSHTISDCTVNGLIQDIHNKQVYLQIHTNSDGDITTNTGPGDFYTPGEVRGELHYVPGSKIFTTLAKPSNEILSQTDSILWATSKATAIASFESTNYNELQYTISGKNLPTVVGINLYLGDQYENSDIHLVDILSSTNPIKLNSDVIRGTITNGDMCPNSHFNEDGTVSHDKHVVDKTINEDGIISHDEHVIDTQPKLLDTTPGTCYGTECVGYTPEPTGILINDDSAKELSATLTVMDSSSDYGYNFGNDFSSKRILADIHDITFPITYNLNGQITKITINEEENSLSIYLDNVLEDKFTLRIPRELVDATNNNFLVMVTASPEKLTEYEIISSNEEFFTIQLTVPDSTSKVTIIGTRVIPEFGGIAMMILGIAIISIVGLTAKTKMFVRF